MNKLNGKLTAFIVASLAIISASNVCNSSSAMESQNSQSTNSNNNFPKPTSKKRTNRKFIKHSLKCTKNYKGEWINTNTNTSNFHNNVPNIDVEKSKLPDNFNYNFNSNTINAINQPANYTQLTNDLNNITTQLTNLHINEPDITMQEPQNMSNKTLSKIDEHAALNVIIARADNFLNEEFYFLKKESLNIDKKSNIHLSRNDIAAYWKKLSFIKNYYDSIKQHSTYLNKNIAEKERQNLKEILSALNTELRKCLHVSKFASLFSNSKENRPGNSLIKFYPKCIALLSNLNNVIKKLN